MAPALKKVEFTMREAQREALLDPQNPVAAARAERERKRHVTPKTPHVYESAKDTAKKIRVALKKVFPGVKFTVRSSRTSFSSSVRVSWVDGPMQDAVQSLTDSFQSFKSPEQIEAGEHKGYYHEGKRYMGASYVFANRTVSEDRREIIDAAAEHMHGFKASNLRYIKIIETERMLIKEGLLN